MKYSGHFGKWRETMVIKGFSEGKANSGKCWPMIERITSRNGHARYLNYAGRLRLIKHVVFGITAYWVQVLSFPKNVIKWWLDEDTNEKHRKIFSKFNHCGVRKNCTTCQCHNCFINRISELQDLGLEKVRRIFKMGRDDLKSFFLFEKCARKDVPAACHR